MTLASEIKESLKKQQENEEQDIIIVDNILKRPQILIDLYTNVKNWSLSYYTFYFNDDEFEHKYTLREILSSHNLFSERNKYCRYLKFNWKIIEFDNIKILNYKNAEYLISKIINNNQKKLIGNHFINIIYDELKKEGFMFYNGINFNSNKMIFFVNRDEIISSLKEEKIKGPEIIFSKEEEKQQMIYPLKKVKQQIKKKSFFSSFFN